MPTRALALAGGIIGALGAVALPSLLAVTPGWPGLGALTLAQGIAGSSSPAIVLMATYSRYNDISPLEHELRADITEILAAAPGIYLARLVERTDRPASTVRYHTRVLEREGELERASVWGNLRLFPPDTEPESFPYYAAIRDPASARVLRGIEAHEPVTPGRLADLIGRAPSTISHHLARFEEEDLIDRRRDGETVHVEIAGAIRPFTRRE